MRWDYIRILSEAQFIRATGVSSLTFLTMVEKVQDELRERKYPGRPATLSIEDQVLLTLMYFREYRTYFMIGLTYQLTESTIKKIIDKITDLLIESAEFQRIKSESLLARGEQSPDSQQQQYLVDATEIRIERPTEGQEDWFSGKKNIIR